MAVTVLAFIYVPLNLATSIFGMNLSELNGSGKSLVVFIATAVIGLVITGASWYLLEEVNKYFGWRSSAEEQTGTGSARKRLTIGPRISMLVWLQRHGHSGWMWKSGAWWRIIVNSDSQVKSPLEARGLNAFEVVSKHVLGANEFDPNPLYSDYDWNWGPSGEPVMTDYPGSWVPGIGRKTDRRVVRV